jgi:hypothetical protein
MGSGLAGLLPKWFFARDLGKPNQWEFRDIHQNTF